MVRSLKLPILLVLSQIALALATINFVCRGQVPYLLDNFYPCECNVALNNTLNCDLTKCPPTDHVKQKCSLGEVWKKDCNQCWCRPIGMICTNLQCKEVVKIGG